MEMYSFGAVSVLSLKGLEVLDGGHRIRFNWRDLIPTILHNLYAVLQAQHL